MDEHTGQVSAPAEQGNPRSKNVRSRRRWLRNYVGIPMAAGFVGTTAMLAGLKAAPLPVQSFLNPTQVDDREGTVLETWTPKGDHSQIVPLDEIPLALQHATIAVEDAHFYQHSAFSLAGIARATLVNLRHHHVDQGGSTITQQLARTLFLNQDRTLSRKIREALYSIQLEMHESKSTILDEYLNYVYYGHGAYGAPQAAQVYFGRPITRLNLAECAMLAGLPQAPSAFDPFLHFNQAKSRQVAVLHRMAQAGYITDEEAAQAAMQPIQLATESLSSEKAPYFTEVAVSEAKRRFGITSDNLYAGGLRITTTLDPVLQQSAERAVSRLVAPYPKLQAAVIVMDPRTGAIRAMVGGRDYLTSPYNRSFATRQPGSTFKAVVYASALEHGWTPANQVKSTETTFRYDGDKSYTVRDFAGEFAERPLTLRAALARSDNVYAVTTNLQVGPSKVIDTARRMGITSELLPYPSLALGVFPTSPLEMATAYATLANGGFRVTPYAVAQVNWSNQNRTVSTTPEKTGVISPQVAFQMSDLMQSVLQPGGTAYAIHSYLHSTTAAKTGTTDTDGWMVGYTPTTVCAVWVGYDDNRPLALSEAHVASRIFAHVMNTAEQRFPSSWYRAAAGLVPRLIDPLTAKLATNTCADTEYDYFVPGTEPKESCPLHPAAMAGNSAPKPHGLLGWIRSWF